MSTAAYELTALGAQQLHHCGTDACASEIEMLVRIDARLPLAQVRAGMALDRDRFDGIFRWIEQAGWIRARVAHDEPEPGLGRLAAPWPEPDAATVDSGELALRRQGFFVQIVRHRCDGAQRGPGPLHAVVIEDEPVLARFTKSYLRFDGIEARIAADRNAIMATLSSPPVPDVILLDVHLPDADGFEILARLREHPVFRQVPVIMLTADASRQSVIRGVTGGADGYISKPFEADTLTRAVRTCLGLENAANDGRTSPWTNFDAKLPRQRQSGR